MMKKKKLRRLKNKVLQCINPGRNKSPCVSMNCKKFWIEFPKKKIKKSRKKQIRSEKIVKEKEDKKTKKCSFLSFKNELSTYYLSKNTNSFKKTDFIYKLYV